MSQRRGLSEEARQRLAARYRMVDGQTLRTLTEAGLIWLRTNQQIVNSLNVFPVPDGDTGTNMTLTMQAAWDEVATMGDRSIAIVAQTIAHGALMGARGNSGVILSQLWRGFARSLEGKPEMDPKALVQALGVARDTAYRGVVQPVEGTILTVSKDIAEASARALESGAESVLDILERCVEAADASVKNTPNLLPILKDAGVVDSGGKGLFFLFEGMLRSVYQLPLDKPVATVLPLSSLAIEEASEHIEPGQDWEVVVDFKPTAELDLNSFYQNLETMGTSIQVGEGDGIFRMHIHVPDRTEYEPIEYIKNLGTVTNVAIENLMIQVGYGSQSREAHALHLDSIQPGQIAAVVVTPGPGIARVFFSLGAAATIEGGQTMNPSTQELLNAFENLPTDEIVILPNNKNIILAAKQARDLTVKKVRVIPTVSVPQGVSAMLSFDPSGDPEQVAEAMEAAIGEVQTGELTVATRSVEIQGIDVEAGQVIGLLDGRLVASGDDLEGTLLQTLRAAEIEETELITLYYGCDLNAKQANLLADIIRRTWSDKEVEVVDGGQPHYQMILSIE